MTCEVCGGAMHMVEQEGGVEEGWFIEHYECASCGSKGYVRGKAEQPPNEWSKFGRAFMEPKTRGWKYGKTYAGEQCKSMDAQKNRHRIINNGR